MRRKRTEITVEKRELLIVKRGDRETTMCCKPCEETVQAWSPESAAALTGVPRRLVYKWVEAARVHFVETVEGEILICNNSLFRAYGDQFQINLSSEEEKGE